MTLLTGDELAAIDGESTPEELVEQAGKFYDLIASDNGVVEIRIPQHFDGRLGVASGFARSKEEFLRIRM